MMQPLISALNRVDGTILHLGAGECHELDAYLKTAAERIVLVEPDPEAAQALRLRTEAEKRVTVIETAVASKGSEAKLHRYNVAGLATLHPLKSPPAQWPGLRETTQIHAKVVDPAQLFKGITLDEGKQHWLVIETPGEEIQVLKAIREYKTPQRFAYLSLTIGSLTPQMEQARSALLQALEETGYRLEHVVTQAGQMVYHAKTDAQWQTIEELKTALKSSEETNQQLKQKQQSLEKLQASNGTLHQENRQLKAENEEIQQRQAQLEEELRKAEVQVELIKELFFKEGEAPSGAPAPEKDI